MMQQLMLDIRPAALPQLDNFIWGDNPLLEHCLKHLQPGAIVYIWGGEGVGKTHLLQALTAQHQGMYQDLRVEPIDDAWDIPQAALYAFDNVDKIDESTQKALFDFINICRQPKGDRPAPMLVMSGSQSAMSCTHLRTDLKNRLGWGYVFEVQPLTEETCQAAFLKRANALGIEISPQVLKWIFTYQTRNIKALIELLDNLDDFSLSQKRQLTLPLIKSFLEQSL